MYRFFDDYDINANGAIEIGRAGAPLHFSSASSTVFDPVANTDAILDDTTVFAPNSNYKAPGFDTSLFFDSSLTHSLTWYHYYMSTTTINTFEIKITTEYDFDDKSNSSAFRGPELLAATGAVSLFL